MLVVDDDEHFRTLLGEVLSGDGFTVVGTAADGRAAIRLVGSLRPDAVTMDLEMPRMSGVEATRAIARFLSAPPVVIVSGSTCGELAQEAIDAGAVARVSKLEAPVALGPAVRAAVGSGGRS